MRLKFEMEIKVTEEVRETVIFKKLENLEDNEIEIVLDNDNLKENTFITLSKNDDGEEYICIKSDNFMNFTKLLNIYKHMFEIATNKEYIELVEECIEILYENIDMEKMDNLVDDIKKINEEIFDLIM